MNELRKKIGQMLMVGLAGEAPTTKEQSILRDHPFGGFILLSRNCRTPDQILTLCRWLWKCASEKPPFIAIDQEGGRVHRLPQPFTHFPAAGVIGSSANPDLAYQAGRATAAELSLVGINLDFAPVLDVNSNPQNPVIGDRSFGSDPAEVIRFGTQWAQGLRDGGVIPCGKHFPGHGDTDKDSHLDLPAVDNPLKELTAVELPPFVYACGNQIESLMTAHVVYRALDPQFPATLSDKIVTGLLRQELGYDGVVFGDDMEMKAINDHYGSEEAALLSLRAGIDVLLFCQELSKAVQVFELFCAEAEKNPALRSRVENSYRRITKLKQRYLKTFTGSGKKELLQRLGQLDHRRIVDEIQGSL